MSRSSTTKQKITRNLKYLLKISEHLAELYKSHKTVFYQIESTAHFPLLHHEPLWEVNFETEIKKIENTLENYSYAIDKKILADYYNCLVKTNQLIKEKYYKKCKGNKEVASKNAIQETLYLLDNGMRDNILAGVKTPVIECIDDIGWDLSGNKTKAIECYKNQELSLGKCAELAEMTKEDFIKLLGQHEISIFQFEPENELLEDVKNADIDEIIEGFIAENSEALRKLSKGE